MTEATSHAVAFVAARRDAAERRGAELADLVNDPDAFATALRRTSESLADPAYLPEQQRVAPGIGPVVGVRWPLLAAVARGFRRAAKGVPATPLLFVADRLFDEPYLEARWFAFELLTRTLPVETERTWQLLRRAAGEAGDWITVDSLAHPYAQGVHAEPYRWAELEQLVFSPSRWERRLVGSTIATMTHVSSHRRRDPDVARHALPLLDQLIGDDEPDVQKALAWAYRSLTMIDPEATATELERQASIAASDHDGHRAWVVRDALPKLPSETADRLRAALAGVRRRAGDPSTSVAAATAARFGRLPDPAAHPRPPLA